MSYSEEYRRPYSSPCACGKGVVRYYEIVETNDWGQTRDHRTAVVILCDYCKKNYYYHHETYPNRDFLIPNDLPIPAKVPDLSREEEYSSKELFVGQHDKSVIETMVADMTAPKRKFIRHLTYEPAIRYACEWNSGKKQSLQPGMIQYLKQILDQYDELLSSYKRKKPIIEAHKKQTDERRERVFEIEEKSFRLTFEYDAEQDKLDHERARKEREEYIEAHKFDPFDARVIYHSSCRIDATGLYWDSLHILECIDPEHFTLHKPQYGSASITISKKYKCKCIACGKEMIVDSSGFEILYNEDRGYYPALQCDCHKTSSFEAKTMDILNKCGIAYAREVSLRGLVGDNGYLLRFDFAIFHSDSKNKQGRDKIRFLMELQGPHHYKQGEYDEYGDFIEDKDNISSNAKNRMEKQKRYDGLKKKYCDDHRISLEYIKYTSGNSYKNLEEKIVRVLKKYGFDVCVYNESSEDDNSLYE